MIALFSFIKFDRFFGFNIKAKESAKRYQKKRPLGAVFKIYFLCVEISRDPSKKMVLYFVATRNFTAETQSERRETRR